MRPVPFAPSAPPRLQPQALLANGRSEPPGLGLLPEDDGQRGRVDPVPVVGTPTAVEGRVGVEGLLEQLAAPRAVRGLEREVLEGAGEKSQGLRITVPLPNEALQQVARPSRGTGALEREGLDPDQIRTGTADGEPLLGHVEGRDVEAATKEAFGVGDEGRGIPLLAGVRVSLSTVRHA